MAEGTGVGEGKAEDRRVETANPRGERTHGTAESTEWRNGRGLCCNRLLILFSHM